MPDLTANPPPDLQRDPQQAIQSLHRARLPRARPDLLISPQLYLGKTVYVVKDPVSLTYFRLNPAEYFILRRLDGQTSAEQLVRQAAGKFPDQHIDADQVIRFIHMLQSSGLIHGRHEQHGSRLRKMELRRRRLRRRALLTSFLFIKVPLLDPDRLLNWLHRWVGPWMNRLTCHLSILFMIVSLMAALSNLWRVGDLEHQLLSWTNLALLSAIFFLAKVIHEFGHGLAAKHRGLEVHEMGVMFMVFLPLYYVDVTDAWVLPRRSDRLWITAGGVFVEFLLASVAVWVWLLTEPGWVNQGAFNIMLATSFTTLLFNANPLLRYDGYYFLMDWLETPNLRAKAGQFIGYLSRRRLLGMRGETVSVEAEHRPRFMFVYAVAASIYRWFVTIGIITLIWHALDRVGLEAIGALLACLAVVTTIGVPMYKTLSGVWKLRARIERRLAVIVAGLMLLIAAAAGLLALPYEASVRRPVVVMAPFDKRQPLFAAVDGRVDELMARTGQIVETGQPILRIANEDLQTELQSWRASRRVSELRLNEARQRDSNAGVAVALAELRRIDDRTAFLEKKISQLIVRAPFAGRLYCPQRLESMLGRRVSTGDFLAVVIDAQQLRFVAILPEKERRLVASGMPARIRLWPDPDRPIDAVVEYVGAAFIEQLPHPALASAYGGEVDTRIDDQQNLHPIEPSVIVTLHAAMDPHDPGAPALIDGLTGRGRIVLGRSSFGAEQWRKIRQAISLDWWL